MSFQTFNNSSPPGSVAGGKVTMYADLDGQLKKVDSNAVTTYVAGQKRPNDLGNSGFWFWQRLGPTPGAQAGSATDRTRICDQWSFVGQNVTPARIDTDAASEVGLQNRYYGQFTKTTGTGKVVLTNPIEGVNAQVLRGRVVRVQMLARTITANDTFRLGLAQLTAAGVTDTIPQVNFITALNAAGTDPTLGANLAYIAPIAGSVTDNGTIVGNALTCAVTTGWQRFGAVFMVPTTVKNLMPVIWSDNLLAINNGLCITQVSISDGYEVVDWTPNAYPDEYNRVVRYFYKSFAIDTAPAQNLGVNTGCFRGTLVKAAAVALAAQVFVRLPTPQRIAAPTVTTFNPAAANAQVRQTGGTAGDLNTTAAAVDQFSSLVITATGIATGTLGDQVQVHATVDSEL